MMRDCRDLPATYEVRVGSHLPDRCRNWLDGLSLERNPDGTTTLRGTVRDQAGLHGLLIRIRDLGSPLLSLRQVHLPPEHRTDNHQNRSSS